MDNGQWIMDNALSLFYPKKGENGAKPLPTPATPNIAKLTSKASNVLPKKTTNACFLGLRWLCLCLQGIPSVTSGWHKCLTKQASCIGTGGAAPNIVNLGVSEVFEPPRRKDAKRLNRNGTTAQSLCSTQRKTSFLRKAVLKLTTLEPAPLSPLFKIILLLWVQSASAQEYIIQLQPKTSIENILNSTSLDYKKTLSKNLNIHLVTGQNKTQTYQILRQHPDIQFIEENLDIQWRSTPNDPRYDTQWALDTIQAEQAWAYTTGGLSPNNDTIVAAVIDRSFDVLQEDLIDNIWHNHDEIPNNQIDDDQNGFIDDYTGWQMVYNTDLHNYGSINNHGTSVLGIIGAKGNNGLGISGINWDLKLMLLSAHTATEITKISNIIEGFSYILEMRRLYNQTLGQKGAFIVAVNSSWGIDYAWAEDHPIWCALYDSLGAVGILSVAATTNNDEDIDKEGDMPCTCSSKYLLGVSESSKEDRQVAGYGSQFVELFAPAESKSTRWNNNYGDFGGTSGAAPHVTGAIALLYAYQNIGWSAMIQQSPQNAALLVKSILLNSVDKKTEFEKSVSGGRLNLGRAMQELAEHFTQPESGALLNIYPIPTQSILTIKAALNTTGEHPIRIYNYLGQIADTWTIQNNSPTISYWHFDVRHLDKGVYILELETDSKKYVEKFVKY